MRDWFVACLCGALLAFAQPPWNCGAIAGVALAPWLVAASFVGGLAGSLFDSLLGATVQALYLAPAGETERRASRDGAPNRQIRGWRWMNNDMVNLLSSLVGGAVALAVLALAG